MHMSAWLSGYVVFNLISTFYKSPTFQVFDSIFRIMEVGSQDVNGNLRTALNLSDLINVQNVEYIGTDNEAGKNVDLVVSSSDLEYPFPVEHFNAIITTSALEHDPRFWVTYLKMLKVLKPGGLLYINVPFDHEEHRHPVDCWRFYGDAGEALASWGRDNGHKVNLIFNALIPQNIDKTSIWNDVVMIFYKQRDNDTEETVYETIEHFNTFHGLYEEVKNDIFIHAEWVKHQNKYCYPNKRIAASNGTVYELTADCQFTELYEVL